MLFRNHLRHGDYGNPYDLYGDRERDGGVSCVLVQECIYWISGAFVFRMGGGYRLGEQMY